MRRKHRTLALVRRRRLRAPHIPSPDVRGVGCAGSGQPRTVSPDVRCGPCGLRSLGCACAGGSASAWASACAGQLRRLPGYGELEASSNESPRRKPRGCPGGETLRVFPSAHASGFQTGRRGVTPAVETAYVTSAGRKPKRRRSRRRRHIRVSEAQDGRSERPARRYGVTPSRRGYKDGKRDACPTQSTG
jgi:hypothetical protein